MDNRCVLLLNAEYVQSIVLGKSFLEKGWRVVCFCSGKCTSGYVSKYLDEHYVVPNIKSERDQFDVFFRDYLSKHDVSLIIPMIDDSAEYLSENKETIEKEFNTICAVETKKHFDYARNKNLLMALCKEYGIPHPRTASISKDNLIEVADYIQFPALIKPDFSAGARGITRVNTFKDFVKSYPSVYEEFGSCTLQQLIEQPDYYYNVMMYRGSDGTILGETVIKIRRYFPIQGGTGCYAETVKMDSLCSECKKVLDILDWHGFADFDVLIDKLTNEFKIIEINPRVPSSLIGSVAAGVDFGAVYAYDLFGEDMRSFEYKEGNQIRWMGLDVLWFLFSPDRFRFKPSWFRFWGKNVSYFDGSFANPLPMIVGCVAGVLKYMDPKVRKEKLKH